MVIRSAVLTDNHNPQTRMNTGFRPATRHWSNGEKRGLGREKLLKATASAASGTPQHGHNPRQYWPSARIKKKPARGWLLRIGGPTRTRTWNQRIHVARSFRPGVDYLITRSLRWWGAGGSSLSLRALQPTGSLCTFRRCTAGSAQDCRRPDRCGSPEFFPFSSGPFGAGVTFR